MSYAQHDFNEQLIELTAEECDSVDGGILPFLIAAGAAAIGTAAIIGFIDGIYTGIQKQGAH